MGDVPELSKAEWVIIKLCWDHKNATARQIFEKATAKRDWDYQTVKTMLDRLVVKGYLSCEKLGPICLYDPIVPKSKAVGNAIKLFMETVLDNAAGPMMAHLARRAKLSAEEIAELKKLIAKQEERDK